MRYYIYVSDSKLEMLYEQISLSAREKIAGELNINFGVIQTKFRSETVSDARHQKILMVEKYLSKRISSMEEGRPYVAGTGVAAWGPFGDYTEVVYFGGFSNGIHFGLMGSLSNCLGMPNSCPTGYSLTSYIVHTLAKRKLLPSKTPTSFCNGTPADELTNKACEGVIMANQCSINPKEKIQFLARTVISKRESDSYPYSVYIGSPIYVVVSDSLT